MKYFLLWSDKFDKEYGKYPPYIAQRISSKLESILGNPHRTVDRCEEYPYYYQRIGTHCAILDTDDTTLQIRVHSVRAQKESV